MAPVMNTVYLNGRFMPAEEATISPLDRGFVFSDGAYEVVPAIDGQLFRLEQHLQRLARSLGELRIDNPMTLAQWSELAWTMIDRHGSGDLSLYLQVTRGAPARRDHPFPDPPVSPTVFLSASPLARSQIYDIPNARGGRAITRDDIRWSRCDIKAIALLPNILYRQQAAEAGAIEAILLRNGVVTEGSSTNIFVVKDGAVATPPLSNHLLAGVTRQVVVDLCRDLGLRMDEREITEAELRAADEIWLSSSSKDAMPIVTLDEAVIGTGVPGPVWARLAARMLTFKHG